VTENDRREGLARALSGVERLYTGNLAEHGIDSRSVGWPSRASQLLRFEKLYYVVSAAASEGPLSFNDWGCGYGALFKFLDQRLGERLVGYTGYDISREMLDAAAEEIGEDPRVELIEGSEVTRKADFSLVSGTFNVRLDAGDADWEVYVKEVLRALNENSHRGFSFNLLSSYVDWRKDDLFYADPAEFFAFCRRELSRFVTVLHDYPLYEWTISVLREDQERTAAPKPSRP
jgi:SAM-dependent methyltransferase